MKYDNYNIDNYNIDIVINTDKGKYLVEVDGVYYHGLIQLEPKDKNYKLMQERK